jgi:Arc/MetJ family transcription regulator
MAVRTTPPRNPLSYFWYDNRMAVSKVSLSLDEEVLAEARERAGRRELSSYVNDALRRRLQQDRLGDLLAEMDAESGPVPEELLAKARQVWHGDEPQRRRRPA